MSLSLLFRSLPATVKRHERTYRETRAVEPRFAPYPTAAELLAAASPEAPLSLAVRQELVRLFVGLHQTTRHPLWQALLLQTFRPMLLGLRRRDRGPREDRDSRVLVAFLQVITRTPRTGRALFLGIGRATARAAFQAVRAEQGEIDVDALDPAMPDTAPHDDPEAFRRCLAHEVAEHIAARPGGEDLVRVLAGVETATAQARRLGAPARRDRSKPAATTAGVRQRKRRALAGVRAELAPSRGGPGDE